MGVLCQGPVQVLDSDPIAFQITAQQRAARKWCGKRGLSWRRLKDLAIHQHVNISSTGFVLWKQTNVRNVDITKGAGKVWYMRRFIYRHNYR
jgi:hypothetical protein